MGQIKFEIGMFLRKFSGMCRYLKRLVNVKISLSKNCNCTSLDINDFEKYSFIDDNFIPFAKEA